jgi:hypothetical protein
MNCLVDGIFSRKTPIPPELEHEKDVDEIFEVLKQTSTAYASNDMGATLHLSVLLYSLLK